MMFIALGVEKGDIQCKQCFFASINGEKREKRRE